MGGIIAIVVIVLAMWVHGYLLEQQHREIKNEIKELKKEIERWKK